MKRPLLLFAISLSAGIIFSYYIHSILFIILSILLISTILLTIKKSYCINNFILLGLILFYTVGAIEYAFVANSSEKRFSEFSDEHVTVLGHIVSEPEIKEQRVSYIVKTEEILVKNDNKRVKGKILLTSLIGENTTILQYGQGVEIRGQIRLPKQSRNPGGFDYRRYLAGSGISATIFAREYNITLKENSQINPIVKTGLFLRKRIINLINSSLPKEQAGLLNGMLIGYRDGLDEDVQNAFSDAGLTHIMAVSGANIAFIVFPLVFLFKRMRIKQNVTNIFIIFILILFMCVTGFSPSVARAVIMAVIILTAQIIKRETDVFTSIALAAIVLILYNPFVLFDIGFQLSFGATISLVLFYKPVKEKISFKFMPAFLIDLLAVTLAAQIGVLPITAYYFNKISVISVFSNIFAVPLTGLITILGFIMVILGQFTILFSQIIGLINSTLLTFILYVTKISSELPFAVLKVVTPNLLIVILYYVIILFLFWYKPVYKPELKVRPVYYIAITLCMVSMFFLYRLLPGSLEVVFVDVGQGDCAFVNSYMDKTVLIDGGGSSAKSDSESSGGDTSAKAYSENTVGENTVVPFLLDYGVSKLDMVIATHGHDDHIQGLFSVIKDIKVGKLIVPDVPGDESLKSIIGLAESKNIPVYRCRSGDIVKLDNRTYFEVMHPQKSREIDESYLNNNSLVLKLFYKKVSMLFTGDIEKEAEELLVKNKLNLKADILKIAHHGSPYSSTEGFLEAVGPSAAVISVGKNNFGHPGENVLKRIEENGIKLYRTDECGAVILKSNGEKVRIKRTIGE